MPPKPKRKRASFKQTAEATPEISDTVVEVSESMEKPSARQVVEVVEEEVVPESIETIRRDAQEIEEAVENLEDAVHVSVPLRDAMPVPVAEDILEHVAEEKPMDKVDSIYASKMSDVRPEITVVGKKDKSLAVWVGAMLGIAVAVGVGLIFLIKGPSAMPSIVAKPTPTMAPTVAPTPTTAPVVTVSRKEISVRVLNGGGVVGAASKMKAFLEAKGYTVVSTGNTPEYTHTSSSVEVKKGKEAYATMLTDDLKADYTLETSTDVVAADATYDAIVIVGKE